MPGGGLGIVSNFISGGMFMTLSIKEEKGFTLVELLVVIAIIGILAAIGIPAYVGQQTRAVRTEAYSNLQNLRLLNEQFFADSGAYVATDGDGDGTIEYKATLADATDDGIEDVLPGFRPGGQTGYPCLGLNFRYELTQNFSITDATARPPTEAASTPCFVARATGCADSRVAGEVFAIDCNNNRNF
jgi:prepilin-type N-terminal cleavage/methylation domain-containing protein